MICSCCGTDFTPTHKRQKVCDRDCHTRRIRREAKEARKEVNRRAISNYKRQVLPSGSKLVALNDFLSEMERISFSSRIRQLGLKRHFRLKKIVFNMTDGIQKRKVKVQYTSLNQIADIIKEKEKQYLKHPRLDYLNSVRHYMKIARRLEKYLGVCNDK